MENDLKLQKSRPDHLWKPGQSGNPAGRPVSSRQKISERLLSDLAEVWEAHGKRVLESLAISDPGKLAQIAYGLLPKDVFVRVEDQRTPGGLDPDAYATLRRLLDLIESCNVDGDPQAVFAALEEDLRARMSQQVTTIEGIAREQKVVS
jgi:hypothetical protein